MGGAELGTTLLLAWFAAPWYHQGSRCILSLCLHIPELHSVLGLLHAATHHQNSRFPFLHPEGIKVSSSNSYSRAKENLLLKLPSILHFSSVMCPHINQEGGLCWLNQSNQYQIVVGINPTQTAWLP